MAIDRPTLRQLEYAVAVADENGFTRAAAHLHVSQPGLSSQVAELERRLGVVLFERGRKEPVATPIGTEVLARARRILRDLDDLVHAAASQRATLAGPLRLSAIPTIAPYLLSAVAREIKRLWPDAVLSLSELRTAELVDAVADAHVDIGLLATPVDTGTLEVAELAFEPFMVAMSDTNPIAGSTQISADQLGNLEILLLEDGHCLREHALAVCAANGAANHRAIHRTGLAVLAQMAAASDAATLLPAAAVPVEARAGSGLTAIPLQAQGAGRTLSIVWRSTDPRSALYTRSAPRLAEAVNGLLGAHPLHSDHRGG